MNNLNLTIKETVNACGIFSCLQDDALVSAMADTGTATTKDEILKSFSVVFMNLCGSGESKTIADYIFETLKYDENPLSRELLCRDKSTVSETLIARAKKEYSLLSSLSLSSAALLKKCGLSLTEKLQLQKVICEFEAGEFPSFDELLDSYNDNGCGEFARANAFIYNVETKSLDPVASPNPIRLSELKEYEEEKVELVGNTRAFIKGLPAQNALLYGERGTGKSSTVSALLNEFSSQGLRIIELSKAGISHLPFITTQLAGLKQRFIIFIDDLSFTSGEGDYATLKASLEGSVNKPKNMLIYATSNRRHLIAESHSERNDDVHAGDTLQEQLSLADRFGLVVTFVSTDKKDFISILAQLLDDAAIAYDIADLTRLAEREAIRKGGRSPRLARQIANTLIANNSL